MPLTELLAIQDNERASSCGVEPFIDIVAVHGLNENELDAWTDPQTNILWLRDLLPKKIKVARVLTYGYNAHVSSFYGSGSVERIQQLAHTFIAELHADRAFSQCLQRPIIFICHGFGGILVKKALAYSESRTGSHVDHLYFIFSSTYGIMFFGTPHNGTEKTNWLVSYPAQDPSRHIAQTLGYNELLHAVEKDSETLQTINDQFTPLMERFHIYFFWEELQSGSLDRKRFVVEEASAAPIIPNTERSGIHANHAQMIQFSTTNSSSYRTVIVALQRYCAHAPFVIAPRQQQATVALATARSHKAREINGTILEIPGINQPFQYPLGTSERGSNTQFDNSRKLFNKHFTIPQSVSAKFTGREEMSQLLEKALFPDEGTVPYRQQKRFVIYGVGGSGKTQFCCKFAQDHREMFWGVFSVDATSAETAKLSLADIAKEGGLAPTAKAGKHWLSQLEESWLLIINNADSPNLELESLFPEGERGIVLVTTRNPDFRILATVGHVEFKGLNERDALLLLLNTAELPEPWDSSTEDTGNRITSTLGYLALALAQAGAQILKGLCDFKDYLNFWNQKRGRFMRGLSPSDPDGDKDNVFLTLKISTDALEERNTEARKDASQILSIVAFFHFERIPVDIFFRAMNNRVKILENSSGRSFSDRGWQAISSRLQPPRALPGFLRQDSRNLDRYRIRKALHELRSFSLISWDGGDGSFSLHPLVHAWARDRLNTGAQAMWAQIALNTLAESILLPPEDTGELHENFRKEILPHLDTCIAACPIQIPNYQVHFGGWRLPFAITFRYISLLDFREQVLRAAKCGYVYAERGRLKDAAILLLQVKDALVQSRGYENALTMRAMLALAGTYWGLGRLDEATALQRTVVDSRTKALGPQHEETLLAMNELGRSYWLNGRYHEALELQTLTAERMKTNLGSTHVSTLEAMSNLGVTLCSWQRYQESISLQRNVLQFREKELGSSHPDTLTARHNLGMALLDDRQLHEAQQLMLNVFEERKRKLGKEHPFTLWALCDLAKVKLELGCLKEAEEMLIPGIEAAKRSLSENHLGVLMGRGALARVIARQQGRFQEAEEITRDTVHRLEESRGLEHPDTVYALWKMARLLELQNKITEAVETCELALQRVNMRLTTQHPLGAKIESHLPLLKTRLEAQNND